MNSASKLFVALASPANQRNMATLKDLKIRLGTVKTISKLTKTLHMVASSKLRSAEKKAEESGPFSVGPQKILGAVTSSDAFNTTTEAPVEERSGKQLLIAITTDTGMCGPVNHQIIKTIKALLKDDGKQEILVSTTGLKGVAPIVADYPNQFLISGRDFGKADYSFPEVLLFLNEIISKVPNYDSALVVYNKFKNALSYNVDRQFIPGFNLLELNRDKFYEYMTSEDRAATMKDLSEFHLASSFWTGLYQNRASEMAARMVAMDNASKNGESISQALGLQYNRARQAMITSELIEIVSGASAIESSD
ncbi:hypothetical protein RB653_003984 [Dictyostelium firmibasis]|uniref:ATP synthase subunit gamma n=1 Tax=Dictyostelium firmibasis TaxID=79012 RepID=A0AAN7U6M4_9MYCE